MFVHCRHVLSKGESLTDLAVRASQDALAMAGVAAADVDLVLFATSSPDDLFGSACQVCNADTMRQADTGKRVSAGAAR